MNKNTGQVIRAVDAGNLSQDWFKEHRWLLCGHASKSSRTAARTEASFLCGLVQNDEDLWDLFDLKICLILD